MDIDPILLWQHVQTRMNSYGLAVENMDYANETDEFTLMHMSDGDLEAEADFANIFSAILSQKKQQTKYTAININSKLTVEQRRVLERVFDVICSKYSEAEAKQFIETVIGEF